MDKLLQQMGQKVAKDPPRLHYRDFGFTEQDLQREFII